MWRLWVKALGEKATKNDREADNVACIRTVLFLTYLVTNCFIIAGVMRHWNDAPRIDAGVYYSPKELYCKQQAGWHPDCNVE